MSTLSLRTNNKELQAALSRAVNKEDNAHMIIHVEGVPFAIQSVQTSSEPYSIETSTISCRMPMSSELTVELEAAFTPQLEDEIRIGDTVYMPDTTIEYVAIGKSTHEHAKTDEPLWIIERQDKAKLVRVRESRLTKTKPLIPKNGEIWECEALNMRSEPLGRRVLYRVDSQWHYAPEGELTTNNVKPIRKLGEIE